MQKCDASVLNEDLRIKGTVSYVYRLDFRRSLESGLC